MRTLQNAEVDLIAALSQQGVQIGPDALKPLRRVDFNKLVRIHDHEEHFLYTVFVSSLVDAFKARIQTDPNPPNLNAADVRTAMLMLGTAVANASEQTISGPSKSVIKEVCPYC